MIIILENKDIKNNRIIGAASDFHLEQSKVFMSNTVVYFPDEGGVNIMKSRELGPLGIMHHLPEKTVEMLKEILTKDAIAKI